MYFDSHAHLGEDCFAQDFVHIVENMRTAGVSGMMEIGFDGPSSHHAVELAHQYDWIWAAVGSHPDDAEQVDEARIGEYRALCKDPRVKAIGEIGLDYHYEDPPRDVQQRAFRMQMKLAQELSLPVVIHEREAHEDGLRIISDFPDVTGVFHCFSGSYEMAKELFEEEPSIDSLVCATDTMAVGAMTYLKEIGLRIPEDVQIAGIGDGVPGKIVEPKLTTVHFYYKTSGMEAAAMLADLIENDTGISKEIKMGCELVERESHR